LRRGLGLRPRRILLSLDGDLLLHKSRSRGRGQELWRSEPLLLPYGNGPLHQRFGLRFARLGDSHHVFLSNIHTLRLQRTGQPLGVHSACLLPSVTPFVWRRHGSEQFTFEKAPSPCQKHWTRLGLGLELADNLPT
jgi:hypothetical protein